MHPQHPPWGAPPLSSSSSAAPPPRPTTPLQPDPPAFTSSFGAFGLPQPRVSTPSLLTQQLERATSAFGAGGAGASSLEGQGGQGGGAGYFSAPASGSTTPFGYPVLGGSALFGGGSTSTSGGGFPFVNATGPRRPSMLAGDATMMESSDDEEDGAQGRSGRSAGGSSAGGKSTVGMAGGRRRRKVGSGGDELMSLSPAYESTALAASSSFAARRSRSRSASESGGAVPFSSSSAMTAAFPPGLFPMPNIPPSPVTVARALQAGQKTPPPFLQRRLFKEAPGGNGMEEDSASGRSSRSGSSADLPNRGGMGGKSTSSALASALLDEDEEIEELTLTLSRSASAGPGGLEGEGGGNVVRRPVSRKPNLLPKTKSHRRILDELRSETLPGDRTEIASEATLHRLSRAGAAAPRPPPGSLRSSCPPSMDTRPATASFSSSSSAVLPVGASAATFAAGAGGSGGAGGNGGRAKPPPNRFPEHAGEDEDADLLDRDGMSSGSSNDGDQGSAAISSAVSVGGGEVGEMAGSDWGGSVLGEGEMGEEERERKRGVMVWNGIRGGPGGGSSVIMTGGTVSTSGGVGRSPGGGERRMGGGGMEVEFATPQTPSFAARPGKRKINDDRFEPYAHQAFKRRAVSPAASLSLSPGYHSSSSAATAGPPSSSCTTGGIGSFFKHPTPPPPFPPSSLSLSISTATSHTQPVAIPSPTGSSFPHPPSHLSSSITTTSAAPPHHQFFTSISGSDAHTAPSSRSVANSPSTSTSLSSSYGGSASRGFGQFVLSDRHRPISAKEEIERRRAELRVEPEGLGRMNLGGDGGGEGEEEQEEL
ncbi:hypothetical protein JCM8547_000659 [Rhodosporidiobolus lusitaniae]